MKSGPRPLADQIKLALESIACKPPPNLKTPSLRSYLLGWITANAIVQHRYRDSAIDVIPIEHPDNGWDRFLITRRTACALRHHERANSFGLILLGGDEGPYLAAADETKLLALGTSLVEDPEGSIQQLLELIPAPSLVSGDHSNCWHRRAADIYPMLYTLLTHILIANPGFIAARELYVDDEAVDGAYHPLYIHTAGTSTGFTYDWFGLQYEERLAFIRLHAHQAVYRTERETWATPNPRLVDLNWSEINSQISTWLQLDRSR